MAATESDKGERWGRWHARDRTRAGSAASNAFMQRQYDETQRRLMALAALRAGERVLDLGAGVGMLTAAARAEVGESGRVVSLDVSADALRQIPAQGGEGEAPVLPVAGCLPAIPIADASVDVALSRSVLIYVPDKRAAAREAARVLRPGGRIAIYEPINRPSLPLCDWGLDFGPLRADHERVLAHLDATWQDREATVGFDEDRKSVV